MKVVLFCGGQGMRMREFSETIPKPMVPIGYRPVLWHLMRYYAHFGHRDFVLALGYRADVIKEYFLDYREWVTNDFVLSDGGRDVEMIGTDIDDWRITFVDTGPTSSIGERLWKVRHHLDGEEVFLANYADGLSDVHLPDMIDHFERTDAIATFLAVRPSQSFHVVSADETSHVQQIVSAQEAGIWVNGGFFVLSNQIFDHMYPGEELVLKPFQRLMDKGRLTSYQWDGFWAGMDTFKDRQMLDDVFTAGEAPWVVWRDQEGVAP